MWTANHHFIKKKKKEKIELYPFYLWLSHLCDIFLSCVRPGHKVILIHPSRSRATYAMNPPCYLRSFWMTYRLLCIQIQFFSTLDKNTTTHRKSHFLRNALTWLGFFPLHSLFSLNYYFVLAELEFHISQDKHVNNDTEFFLFVCRSPVVQPLVSSSNKHITYFSHK